MTNETITQIALENLRESPFNPRRSFTGLDDLAASIKSEQRVHEPLLVRPITGDDGAFEIVFGHRRYRAAEIAGLTTVPCMVRAMNDTEARSAQIAENLQRVDVHPIEEAEGFRALIENDGISADELVEVVGKSRSYIYGRLKLLQACPEVRQACLDGKIGSEVALLIARLRTPQLQAKALTVIKNDTSQHSNMDDGGKKSFRHIRDLLADKFTLDLRRAIFDSEDARLLPSAGVCSTCPKLTGNAPEFEDLATPQRDGGYHHRTGGPCHCTDPECFAAKKAAHLDAKAMALTAAGETVVTGNKAKQAIDAHGQLKAGYMPLKDAQAQLKKAGSTVQVLTILDQRTGQTVKAVKVADVPGAAEKKTSSRASGWQSQQRDWEAERRERDAAAEVETKRRRAMLDGIYPKMLAATGSTDELRVLAALLWVFVEEAVEVRTLKLFSLQRWNTFDLRMKALADFSADQLRALLLTFALETWAEVDYDLSDGKAELDKLASMYALTPSPAADTKTADLFDARPEAAEA